MGGDGWGLTEEVTDDPDEADDAGANDSTDDEPALAESADTTEQSEETADTADDDVSEETETEPETEESANDAEYETLEDELRYALENGDVTDVSTSDVMNDYKEIEDPNLLKEALREDDRKSSSKLYRRQLRNLDFEVKEGVGAPDRTVSVEEGVRKTEQAGLEETASETSDATDEEVEETVNEADSDDTGTTDAEQSSDETAEPETSETESEVDEPDEEVEAPDTDTGSVDEIDDGDDSLEATPEMENTAQAAEEKGATNQGPPSSEDIEVSDDDDSGVTPLDADDVAPDSMTASEAAQKDKRHKIMAFGPPGTFKTHFGYTMPEPICIIDTEGKAHDIAHKFSDKAIHIFQPSNYLEAAGGTDRRGTYQEGALEKALNLLDRYRDEQGVTGTLMVDSMSKMWEWSQLHYISKWHPDDDRPLEEVREDFNSGLEASGPGSWGRIKRYHNAQFRQAMVNSSYHLYWTAKQKEDYSVVFDDEDGGGGNDVPLIPDGEKDNIHEVDTIIHAHLEDGDKIGDLKKSGFTNHGYHNMEYPTFPKHKRVIDKISEWEADGGVPGQIDMEGDTIQVVRGVNVLE